MKDYTNIECCRLCKSNNLQKVYSLGEQTLTGVFPQSKNEIISSGPVDLVKCQSCGLVQLKQTYNQNEMYGDNYGYTAMHAKGVAKLNPLRRKDESK